MAESTSQRSRRDVLKSGVALVPVIMTLHAAPAWAATDYTKVAYRYGVNAGLCRNPNFDPTSNSSWKRDEFIPCEKNKHAGDPSWETESTAPTGDGPKNISF